MIVATGLLKFYKKHSHNNTFFVRREIVILQKQSQIIENSIDLVLLTLLIRLYLNEFPHQFEKKYLQRR